VSLHINLHFLVKFLEPYDKYIWQIVSDLSKLMDNLDYDLYTFTFHHILIFGSQYVSNGFFFLLYVANTCFIEGQHIVINCFMLFICLFSIYLCDFLFYFHKMKAKHTK
jgi:hypothetical protein